MNLITVEEFATFRDISKKRDDAKIEEAIKLAQKSDLLNTLGDFYFDVLANKDAPEWADLMNGAVFTYCDESFEHDGIKALLADYTHARYIYTKNVNDTPFGYITKKTQDGKTVDRNVLKDMQKQDQIDAGYKFIYIEKYIMSEPDLFSRYCKNKKADTPFAQKRFYKL